MYKVRPPQSRARQPSHIYFRASHAAVHPAPAHILLPCCRLLPMIARCKNCRLRQQKLSHLAHLEFGAHFPTRPVNLSTNPALQLAPVNLGLENFTHGRVVEQDLETGPGPKRSPLSLPACAGVAACQLAPATAAKARGWGVPTPRPSCLPQARSVPALCHFTHVHCPGPNNAAAACTTSSATRGASDISFGFRARARRAALCRYALAWLGALGAGLFVLSFGRKGGAEAARAPGGADNTVKIKARFTTAGLFRFLSCRESDDRSDVEVLVCTVTGR